MLIRDEDYLSLDFVNYPLFFLCKIVNDVIYCPVLPEGINLYSTSDDF